MAIVSLGLSCLDWLFLLMDVPTAFSNDWNGRRDVIRLVCWVQYRCHHVEHTTRRHLQPDCFLMPHNEAMPSSQSTYMSIMQQRLSDLEEINGQLVANVAVTVGGTWQKRGHSSKFGVVFFISVDKGEILYYSVKSLMCRECKARNAMNKESDE